MISTNDITFSNNPLIAGQESRYTNVVLQVRPVLASWRQSLFSFEWLAPDGAVKDPALMSEREREKRAAVEARISGGLPLFRPILGIGLMDNVEIGTGREVFLTLAARGAEQIPAHIPAGNLGDFKRFMVQVG